MENLHKLGIDYDYDNVDYIKEEKIVYSVYGWCYNKGIEVAELENEQEAKEWCRIFVN